jgi:hypothetical protein
VAGSGYVLGFLNLDPRGVVEVEDVDVDGLVWIAGY